MKAKEFFGEKRNIENRVSLSDMDDHTTGEDIYVKKYYECHNCRILALTEDMQEHDGKWYCNECNPDLENNNNKDI